MNQFIRRNSPCLKGIVFSLTLLLYPVADAQETIEQIYASNPLLASLHQRDKPAAANALNQIDAILKQPQEETLPKQTSRGTPEFQTILEQNPMLQEAYRRDPRATAKLIGIIRPVNN